MSQVAAAILATSPTSYWPLDETPGAATAYDQMSRNDGAIDPSVQLSVIPFGDASAPLFDGTMSCLITVPNDAAYSQPYANALSVSVWLCPLALDFDLVDGTSDVFVRPLEKSVDSHTDVEWSVRLYNRANPTRHSRLSFYTFKLGSPAGQGNGSYMEYGVSANDQTPVDLGRWLFVVGHAEPWISETDNTTGCIFWKQNVEARRSPADKYSAYGIHPQAGTGPVRIGGNLKTGFKGGIAHVAIWNRPLSSDEIASVWSAGVADLQGDAMYHSYV